MAKKIKKGLVIGDSHAAMIIKAWWEKPEQYPLLDLEFLAQPGNGPRGVVFSRNQIQAREFSLVEFLQKTDCALDYDLTKFDFIAVVGCGLSLYPVLSIFNKYSVVSSPSARTKDNRLRKTLKNPMLSLGCFAPSLPIFYAPRRMLILWPACGPTAICLLSLSRSRYPRKKWLAKRIKGRSLSG